MLKVTGKVDAPEDWHVDKLKTICDEDPDIYGILIVVLEAPTNAYARPVKLPLLELYEFIHNIFEAYTLLFDGNWGIIWGPDELVPGYMYICSLPLHALGKDPVFTISSRNIS